MKKGIIIMWGFVNTNGEMVIIDNYEEGFINNKDENKEELYTIGFYNGNNIFERIIGDDFIKDINKFDIKIELGDQQEPPDISSYDSVDLEHMRYKHTDSFESPPWINIISKLMFKMYINVLRKNTLV